MATSWVAAALKERVRPLASALIKTKASNRLELVVGAGEGSTTPSTSASPARSCGILGTHADCAGTQDLSSGLVSAASGVASRSTAMLTSRLEHRCR
jgi:hypothetical protein